MQIENCRLQIADCRLKGGGSVGPDREQVVGRQVQTMMPRRHQTGRHPKKRFSILNFQYSIFNLQSFPRMSRWLLLAGVIAPVLVRPAAGQSVWELTPYRVRLLVAFAPAPELTPRLRADLITDLVDRAEALVGAAWNVTAAPAPPHLQPAMTSAIESVKLESLPEDALESDKVMLLAVSWVADGCRVTARELDVATQLFSAPVSRPVSQLGKLRDAALGVIFEAFAPLARVENVDKQQVELRLRASALPLRDEALMLVEPGDVFRPVIRYHDRQGNLRNDGQGNVILPKPVPWTFCTVQQVTPGRLECRLQTGLRSPLSGRRRGRVQQLALAVVPPGKPSRVTLKSRGASKRALAGYEVYARPPDSKNSALLGRTDRQGRITVPPGESLLRVLLVRSGSELLARLPIVPGLQPEYTAEVADDDRRLQAEGSVNGLREQLIDLVTRREVLFARARTRIKAGKLDEAEKLIQQLQRLQKSEYELGRMLDLQRRGARADDPGVQRKIDALFDDTQQLFQKYLAPKLIERLRGDLRNARAAGKS